MCENVCIVNHKCTGVWQTSEREMWIAFMRGGQSHCIWLVSEWEVPQFGLKHVTFFLFFQLNVSASLCRVMSVQSLQLKPEVHIHCCNLKCCPQGKSDFKRHAYKCDLWTHRWKTILAHYLAYQCEEECIQCKYIKNRPAAKYFFYWGSC